MSNKYLIVSKEILPDYFDKVIEARELLEQGKVKNISEAKTNEILTLIFTNMKKRVLLLLSEFIIVFAAILALTESTAILLI